VQNQTYTLLPSAHQLICNVQLQLYVQFGVQPRGITIDHPHPTLDENNQVRTHEVWIGKKPSLTHLKVFGCDAYEKNMNKKKKILILQY
jgi:hypothetical protein